MKRNQKGYTFIELMITIAIFGIVMVGISSIMSNASQAYKRGVFENQVQQEAQIALNQISDIICDSTKQLSSATELGPADYGFKIKNTTTTGTTEECIYLKKVGNKLYVSKNKDLELENWELLADNVLTFEILNSNPKDNLCLVNLSLLEDNAKYDASKEVHFRNNFEFNAFETMLTSTSTTPDPDPDSSGFAGDIIVDRGDVINLTADYGDGVYELSDAAESYFDIDDSGECFGTDGDKPYYTLSVDASWINPGNFDLSVGPLDTIYLAKKNSATGPVVKKYRLKIEPVSFSAGSGILLLTPDNVNVNVGGNTTYIPAKGINVNKYLGLTGASGEYKVTLTCGSVPLAGSNSNVINKSLSQVTGNAAYNSGADSSDQFKQGGNAVSFNVNLSADQCSNGLSIVTGNKGFKGDTNIVKNQNPTAEFKVKISKSSQSKEYTINYKIQTTTDQDISKFN